jgi:hypothetical protein
MVESRLLRAQLMRLRGWDRESRHYRTLIVCSSGWRDTPVAVVVLQLVGGEGVMLRLSAKEARQYCLGPGTWSSWDGSWVVTITARRKAKFISCPDFISEKVPYNTATYIACV